MAIGVVCAGAQVDRDTDTTHLTASLARVRGSLRISGGQYMPLQAEYLKWIDARVSAGTTVAAIRKQLEQAKLNPLLGDTVTFGASQAGFVDIREQKVRGATDVFAITASIGVGASCAIDETIILYELRSRRRLAWVNADPSLKWHYYLTGIAANHTAATGEGRLIATGWGITNCTSNWNGKAIRIDRVEPTGELTSILKKDLAAFSGNRTEVVAPWVQLDEVTFFYDQATPLTSVLATPAIEKYRVDKLRAIREAPLGLNMLGFIVAWLSLPAQEVSAWGSPDSTSAHQSIVAMQEKEHLGDLVDIARCGGSTWEVAVRFQHEVVFRIQGERARQLRMVSVLPTHGRDCVVVPLKRDWLSKELPW